jgi:hypothetical protein
MELLLVSMDEGLPLLGAAEVQMASEILLDEVDAG